MTDLNLEQKENGVASDMIITLKNPNKTKHTVQPAYDPNVRWYAGIPRLADDDKKGLEYYTEPESRITLYDGIEFDLSKDVDKQNWDWLKHTKEVAADFETFTKSPTATFYVYIEGREAKNKNKRSALTYEATKFVMEDSPTQYEDRALLLGFDMGGDNPEVIKEFLLEQANDIKTAKKVIEIYTSK